LFVGGKHKKTPPKNEQVRIPGVVFHRVGGLNPEGRGFKGGGRGGPRGAFGGTGKQGAFQGKNFLGERVCGGRQAWKAR